MSATDGGPAFLRPPFVEAADLRDYFAAAALSAVLTQEATSDDGKPCLYDEATVARVAYKLADAMLLARKKDVSS